MPNSEDCKIAQTRGKSPTSATELPLDATNVRLQCVHIHALTGITHCWTIKHGARTMEMESSTGGNYPCCRTATERCRQQQQVDGWHVLDSKVFQCPTSTFHRSVGGFRTTHEWEGTPGSLKGKESGKWTKDSDGPCTSGGRRWAQRWWWDSKKRSVGGEE